MRPFAVLVLLAPGPALAQGLAIDPSIIEACFDSGGGRDCIGAAADACAATPDGSSTVGMGFCYGAERDWWDARLNAAYRELKAREAETDAETKEYAPNAPSAETALRDMQRAWIAWRDAACFYEYTTWGGGTGGGPATAACEMRLTAEQALALEARLEPR